MTFFHILWPAKNIWTFITFFSIIIIAKDCLRILKKVMTMPMICVWDLLQVDLVEDQTNNLQKDAISEPSKNLKKLIFEKSDQIKKSSFFAFNKKGNQLLFWSEFFGSHITQIKNSSNFFEEYESLVEFKLTFENHIFLKILVSFN